MVEILKPQFFIKGPSWHPCADSSLSGVSKKINLNEASLSPKRPEPKKEIERYIGRKISAYRHNQRYRKKIESYYIN